MLTTPEGKALVLTLLGERGRTPRPGSRAATTRAQVGKFVTLFRAPPGRERYEVVFADAPARAGESAGHEHDLRPPGRLARSSSSSPCSGWRSASSPSWRHATASSSGSACATSAAAADVRALIVAGLDARDGDHRRGARHRRHDEPHDPLARPSRRSATPTRWSPHRAWTPARAGRRRGDRRPLLPARASPARIARAAARRGSSTASRRHRRADRRPGRHDTPERAARHAVREPTRRGCAASAPMRERRSHGRPSPICARARSFSTRKAADELGARAGDPLRVLVGRPPWPRCASATSSRTAAAARPAPACSCRSPRRSAARQAGPGQARLHLEPRRRRGRSHRRGPRAPRPDRSRRSGLEADNSKQDALDAGRRARAPPSCRCSRRSGPSRSPPASC